MTDVDLARTFRRTQEEMSADLGEEAVVLHLDSGVYYGMEGVGPRIWQLLEEPRTGREIRDVLLEEFEVGKDRLEADLRSFLGELRDEGLIEVAEGP